MLKAVRLASGREPYASVAVRSEIDELIKGWHGQGSSAIEGIVKDAEREEGAVCVEHRRDLVSEDSVNGLVNLVIQHSGTPGVGQPHRTLRYPAEGALSHRRVTDRDG